MAFKTKANQIGPELTKVIKALERTCKIDPERPIQPVDEPSAKLLRSICLQLEKGLPISTLGHSTEAVTNAACLIMAILKSLVSMPDAVIFERPNLLTNQQAAATLIYQTILKK